MKNNKDFEKEQCKNKDTERIVDKSDTLKNNQEGFLLTVKNLDTGEVILSERTKAIVGAFHRPSDCPCDSSVATQAIIVSACKTPILIGTIEAAEKVVREAKKKVFEGIISKDDFIKDLLATLFGGGHNE